MNKQRFLNTYVSNITMNEALDDIEKMIRSKKKSYVVAVNVDVIMKIEQDEELKTITNEADMVLTDGKPLIWISKLKKAPIKEKISGSDLVPKLCELSDKKGYTIFILGGKDGIAEQAKKKLESQYKNIRIVGVYSPKFGFENDKKELTKINSMINKKKPDLLFVCLGCHKQEKWIYNHINEYDAKVSICAGATVDFLAGNMKRAPKWMSNCGLEWFYRFLQEPKRLFKRYFIDDIKILKLLRKYDDKK